MSELHHTGDESRSNSSPVDSREAQAGSVAQVINSSEASVTSYDDNEVKEFGPIQVKSRKKPAPTLATGRRSKYEVLNPEAEQKREVRRARNRAAAERVRLSRLGIEQDLQDQLRILERHEQELLSLIQRLQQQKIDLQTRIQAQQTMSSTMVDRYPSNASSVDYSSIFPTDNVSTSATFQPIDQMNDLHLDDFFLDALTSAQDEEYLLSNSYSNTMPGDNLDAYLMDP